MTAVQLSRGKAEASALLEAALLAQDLGRFAADVCLFATAEFAFVRLPRSITTGSSMLPQKSNPDVFEIARGRSGEVLAALNEVFSVTMKMPSGYHRDLQLIKKPLFRRDRFRPRHGEGRGPRDSRNPVRRRADARGL